VVEWSNDVSAADWILEGLQRHSAEEAGAVGSFVPVGFPAYARVLHPAWHSAGGRRTKVRWRDLAQAADIPLQATTGYEELEPSAVEHDTEPPLVGSLEEDELGVLAELLAAFTSSPDACWFGVWEGYGWMQGPPAIAEMVGRPPESSRRPGRPEASALPSPARAGARVQVPDRALALYSGTIAAAAAFSQAPTSQSPNLWWPEDHAWCIASEIDFHSTYLGGAQALVDRVVQDERLEALPARLADRVTD